MPVQDRRYFIMKHNAEQQQQLELERKEITKDKNTFTTNGNLNAYAKLEQNNLKRR